VFPFAVFIGLLNFVPSIVMIYSMDAKFLFLLRSPDLFHDLIYFSLSSYSFVPLTLICSAASLFLL
jgi:hypothetical protein